MNTRRMVVALFFALCCSALFTWQLGKHLQHAAPAVHPAAVRDVVVAAKELHAGDPLDPASLTVVKWPASQQYPGLFTKSQELAGRIPLVSVSAGQPIVGNDLVSNDVAGNGNASIPQGMRAVSIHATDDSLTSTGLLTSGSDVDVLVSYRSDADASFVSSVILQDVRVLAIGQAGPPAPGNKPQLDNTITLLLTPQQTAQFTAASGLGKMTFALRNRTDHDVQTDLLHVGVDGYRSHPQMAAATTPSPRTPVARAPKTGFTVETLSGGKSTVQTFSGDQ